MIKPAKVYSLIFIPPLAQYVITLEEIAGTRLVPIWIGVNEGNSIALVLEGRKFPRPLTHDLLVDVLRQLTVTVDKIVINDLKENAYYALVTLRHHDKIFEIDSRPSDALAIAIRAGAPVFIDEKVLAACPVINKPISDEEVKNFERELESLRPEDFFKRLNEAPPSPKKEESGEDEGAKGAME